MTLTTTSPPVTGGSGAWRTVRAELRRRVSLQVSLAVIALFALMTVAAPLIGSLGGWGPEEFDKSAVDPYLGGMPIGPFGGVSAEHWLGVEPINGRDLFARVVHGAQVSLLIAFSATAIVVVAGTAAGIAAGYFGAAPTRCCPG